MKHLARMPDDIGPDRLGELIAAERRGCCRTVPCPVGASVWVLSRRTASVRPVTVDSYHLFFSRRDTVDTVELDGHGGKIFRRWKLNQFGKTLFLSEEEALAALEGQETSR